MSLFFKKAKIALKKYFFFWGMYFRLFKSGYFNAARDTFLLMHHIQKPLSDEDSISKII